MPLSSDSGVTTKLVTAAAWSNLSAHSEVNRPRNDSSSAPISPNHSNSSGRRTSTDTPGHISIASHTAKPTMNARVTAAPISPAISSPVDKGGIR